MGVTLLFEEINQFKYIFLDDVKEEDGYNLVLSLCSGAISEIPEDFILAGVTFKDTRRITRNEHVRLEVIFPGYVAFNIINESFVVPNSHDEFTGSKAREYTKSRYLEYIQNETKATAIWPGQLRHFGFCCEWQIIDVISKDVPAVKVVDTRIG